MAKVKGKLRRVTVEEFDVEFDIDPTPVNVEGKDLGVEAKKAAVLRSEMIGPTSSNVSMAIDSITVKRSDDEVFMIEGLDQKHPMYVLRHSLTAEQSRGSCRSLHFEQRRITAEWDSINGEGK